MLRAQHSSLGQECIQCQLLATKLAASGSRGWSLVLVPIVTGLSSVCKPRLVFWRRSVVLLTGWCHGPTCPATCAASRSSPALERAASTHGAEVCSRERRQKDTLLVVKWTELSWCSPSTTEPVATRSNTVLSEEPNAAKTSRGVCISHRLIWQEEEPEPTCSSDSRAEARILKCSRSNQKFQTPTAAAEYSGAKPNTG